MKNNYTRFFLLLVFSLVGIASHAQNAFFTNAREADIPDTSKRVIIPLTYRLTNLDTTALLNFLKNIPDSKAITDRSGTPVIEIPMPDGSSSHFHIWITSMMEPALAVKYPGILTFTGQGIEDKRATIKIDWTALGFHAMILSAVTGSVFIDPYQQGDNAYYISYYSSDILNRNTFNETEIPGTPISYFNRPSMVTGFEPPASCIGTQLRTYRLAIACTHQYAIAATGFPNPTAIQTLSAVTTTVNRVDGVYENELDIHFTLVAKEDTILFRQTAGDPLTANDTTDLLIDEGQNTIDQRIGNANYDIGQTYSTGAGGGSILGVVCISGQKASSAVGITHPVGDPFAIDYVAHEMGHEFDAHHSFNSIMGSNSCGAFGQFNSGTNSEPGSGSTIMCYASGVPGGDLLDALCGSDNLQENSDPDFNALGFDEITDYSINGNGSSCPTVTATANTPPVVNAGVNYTIPELTPFILTGSATDIDGDSLTYSWEQVNIGGPAGTWNNPSGDAPIFRSFVPDTLPYRYFPKLSDVINNTTTIGEIMPAYARVMNFRLTVRDNHAGGGGVCNAQDAITVDASAGRAFSVTYPTATGIIWNADETKTVTWDAAATATSAVNCANVMIQLSLDGGLTYPDTLLASTSNNGSAIITVPNTITTTARIRVMAIGNVFYNISANNFAIAPSAVAEVWNVYPNPTAARNVTITSNKADTYVQLALYDDIGRLIYTEDLPATTVGQTITVPMALFSKGAYMLKINTSRGLTAKRILLIDK